MRAPRAPAQATASRRTRPKVGPPGTVTKLVQPGPDPRFRVRARVLEPDRTRQDTARPGPSKNGLFGAKKLKNRAFLHKMAKKIRQNGRVSNCIPHILKRESAGFSLCDKPLR